MSSIENLLEIMARLRDPEGGCPWDREQSFATIAPYTIEEAYEVADAIERNDLDSLRDELGDLLLQVVYHARMAQEIGAFDFGAVVSAICDKLVRRHPHVFGGTPIESAQVVYEGVATDISVSAYRTEQKGYPARQFVRRATTFYTSELYLRKTANSHVSRCRPMPARVMAGTCCGSN